MIPAILVLLLVSIAFSAPPEISLTVHRIVDEDQNLNETLVVHATHDVIILESSDVLERNGTEFNSTEVIHPMDLPHTVVNTRLTREANITRDSDGKIVVQLPTKGDGSTDVVVGNGTHVVNQISGELAVESHGGWIIRIRTGESRVYMDKFRRTDYVKQILIYDTETT